MTTAQLKKAKNAFPKTKTAPVVIYSDNTKAAKIAFKTVRKWGFKNASILEGGINGWTTAGNKLVSGQLAGKIVYVPKPVKGSIAVSEFRTIARNLPADAVILDVRDKAEVEGGMIEGAINIPTQEVASRLGEIPKGKKVVIHCRSGIRASMAYQTLKEKGFDAYFLNARISIAPDGSFKIDS